MVSTTLLLLVMCIHSGYQNIFRLREKNHRKCINLLREPNYNNDKVAGHLWREFYSWNLISKKCLSTEFRKPTRAVIHHYETYMNDYVQEKLEWNKANLLAKSGKHEMLMIPDEEAPGSFLAIPNLDRFGLLYEYAKEDFQPMMFAMKLVHGNKFLIMLDCMGGLGHIMVKVNDTVTEAEILTVAKKMALGKGLIGCKSFISTKK